MGANRFEMISKLVGDRIPRYLHEHYYNALHNKDGEMFRASMRLNYQDAMVYLYDWDMTCKKVRSCMRERKQNPTKTSHGLTYR